MIQGLNTFFGTLKAANGLYEKIQHGSQHLAGSLVVDIKGSIHEGSLLGSLVRPNHLQSFTEADVMCRHTGTFHFAWQDFLRQGGS